MGKYTLESKYIYMYLQSILKKRKFKYFLKMYKIKWKTFFSLEINIRVYNLMEIKSLLYIYWNNIFCWHSCVNFVKKLNRNGKSYKKNWKKLRKKNCKKIAKKEITKQNYKSIENKVIKKYQLICKKKILKIEVIEKNYRSIQNKVIKKYHLQKIKKKKLRKNANKRAVIFCINI